MLLRFAPSSLTLWGSLVNTGLVDAIASVCDALRTNTALLHLK
jgi:hypothetical protein